MNYPLLLPGEGWGGGIVSDHAGKRYKREFGKPVVLAREGKQQLHFDPSGKPHTAAMAAIHGGAPNSLDCGSGPQ